MKNNLCEKYIWTNAMLTGMIDMLDCAFTNMKYSWGASIMDRIKIPKAVIEPRETRLIYAII